MTRRTEPILPPKAPEREPVVMQTYGAHRIGDGHTHGD